MTTRRHPVRQWGILLVLAALVCVALPWWQPREAHAASSPALTPLSLISANLPAYTNDPNAYDPSLANDTNYGTVWDSVDTPSSAHPIWVALDLSTVPVAKRQQVILAWFNDSGEYLPGADNIFYNLPSNYTIDANAAAGGAGAPPSAGWVTLLTVTGNTRNAREHVVNLSGDNWVRMTVTGSKGSSGNTSAAFNLDLYDASAGDQDDWLFLGDSITEEGMTQANVAGGPWTSGDYAQLVHSADASYYPLQIDGGMGGWTSDDGAQNIAALMSGFTGKYVSLAFGTNDANEPYVLSTSQIQTYYANMLAMIDAAQSAGKIAIVPYVPWGCNGDLGQNAQALNTFVNAHLATDRPSAIRGPDLWTPFSQNHSWISSDCIHPTYQAPSGQLNGFEQYQRIWEQWSIANIYAPSLAPAVSLSPTSLNFGSQNVGTSSAAQTVTLTNSGNAALTINGLAVSGTNAADFAETTTCPLTPSTLAAHGSCTIRVTFTPSASGTRSGTVSITDSASDSPQSLSLTGVGVTSAPGVTLSPTTASFGSQNVGTTSAAQSITLTNSGAASLTISSIALGGANAADFAESANCPISPNTLASGATCAISVTFSPTVAGSRSAAVSISDNAGGSPQSVPLSGTGVTPTTGMTLTGSSTAKGNFSAGVSIKIPGVQAGDLLIAAAGSNGSPASWTTPTGWTAGAGGGHPDRQGLNWWWKIATNADSGATVTLRAASYADGGGIVLAYRGASASPILAVSALATNDNGGHGHVTSAQFNGVSWSGATSVVSLLLVSWQPARERIIWPTGFVAQATATDGYSYVAAGANLAVQAGSSLSAQTATLPVAQATVPTLQIAIQVGS